MTSAPPLDLSIVIPVYRAGSFIESSLVALSSHMDRQGVRYEIIAVDDGSQDDSLSRLRAIAGESVRALSLVRNQGKGAAIKRGIAAAEGKYIVATDADIPYGPESIMHCYAALREGGFFSIGDRTLGDSRRLSYVAPMRRLLSMVYSLLIRPLVAPSGLRDTQCGLKGFRSDFGKALLSKSRINRFAFDSEMIVFAIENRVPVSRVAVVLLRNDYSSFRIPGDPLNMLWDVVRIAYGRVSRHYRVESFGSQLGGVMLDGGMPAATVESPDLLAASSRKRGVK